MTVRTPDALAEITHTELAQFRMGEANGVRAVYRAHAGTVFAVARRILGSSELADEAAQQAFVNAWRAAITFDSERQLGPWLATIARRAAIDIYRREARRVTVPLEHAAPNQLALPDDTDATSDVWEIRAAVDELGRSERELVRMMHLEQLTHVEIAERLGIPLGTVKSRSHRAHRRLAARLGHLRSAT